MKKISLALLMAALASGAEASHSTNFSERFQFSGFGRIVAGYLDEDKATYEGYGDNLSLGKQSLLALQTDFEITNDLSLAAQLLAHSSEERDSGIEWLYLNYEPSQNWRFKAGRLRTPFFNYSDVIDVGFAYPWITAPQQVYSAFLFSQYEGATATYRFSLADANIDIEAYTGQFDGDYTAGTDEIYLDANSIQGLIVQARLKNITLRASYTMSADFDIDLPEITQFEQVLRQAGFVNNANALSFDGDAEGFQASINYDGLDYFAAAEIVSISSDLLIIPQTDSFYIMGGYNFYPYQVHLTYASSSSSYSEIPNEIPRGLTPQLDALSFGYDNIINNLPEDDLDSITIGTRWDFKPNMALKFEISMLSGEDGKRSFFDISNNIDFDRDANLYQLALEWVF